MAAIEVGGSSPGVAAYAGWLKMAGEAAPAAPTNVAAQAIRSGHSAGVAAYAGFLRMPGEPAPAPAPAPAPPTDQDKRQAARAKVIAAKNLAGFPEGLIRLPDTDDEKALAVAADKLVADLSQAYRALRPAQPEPDPVNALSGLSKGVLRFAQSLRV